MFCTVGNLWILNTNINQIKLIIEFSIESHFNTAQSVSYRLNETNLLIQYPTWNRREMRIVKLINPQSTFVDIWFSRWNYTYQVNKLGFDSLIYIFSGRTLNPEFWVVNPTFRILVFFFCGEKRNRNDDYELPTI